MWQMATSADEINAATGANSGAKLKRCPGEVANLLAADITRLSVSTSPVAMRLNDRAGGVRRTADDGPELMRGPGAAAPTVVAATAMTSSINPPNRASPLVTTSR
jgi:hypothetical protein